MEILNEVNNLIEKNKKHFNFASFSCDVIKLASELLNDKCKNDKLFITEGMWSVPYIIKHNIKVNAVIFNPECITKIEGLNAINHFIEKTELYVISQKVLNNLTKRNDDNGIYFICELPNNNFNDIFQAPKSIVCVLDGIEKSGNIGTILRTCDGAKIDGLLIVNKRAKLNNTGCVKASMGGIFSVPTKTYNSIKDCWQDLAFNGYSIYLADTRAEIDYFKIKYENKVAIIMGSERYGISKEWYETNPNLIKINMFGDCDSLNVGVATSILLYDAKMKQLGD